MTKPKKNSGLAARLNRLFDSQRRYDGKEWSNGQVAKMIVEQGLAESFSESYLWQLRNGVKTNPTMSHVAALAAFFKVEVNYFFEDEVVVAKVDGDQAPEATIDPEFQLMALRAGELTPEGRQRALDMLKVVWELDRRGQQDSAHSSPEDPQHRTLG